jgi:hypothetical protein
MQAGTGELLMVLPFEFVNSVQRVSYRAQQVEQSGCSAITKGLLINNSVVTRTLA